MKTLLLTVLAFTLTACTQKPQTEQVPAQNSHESEKVDMPQDCQQYFDELKNLAKDNQNLAEKFGDKLAKVNETWQILEDKDRQKFSEQCTIRNKQLQEMKGTPELENLLNKL